jgi:DNA-directed RNA polymerase specialized sigma24 family protein
MMNPSQPSDPVLVPFTIGESGALTDSESNSPQSEFIRQALEQFESPLIRYALRLTGNLDRARDVVQDTFLKLCRQTPDSIDGNLAR